MARSYPDGSKKTFYKRTFVEEFAPYVQEDGLSVRLIRYSDFECTNITSIEEQYKNRKDKLRKRVKDVKTNMNTEYFLPGREDCIKSILKLLTDVFAIFSYFPKNFRAYLF